jgi:hypothetical protein
MENWELVELWQITKINDSIDRILSLSKLTEHPIMQHMFSDIVDDLRRVRNQFE